MSESWKYTKPLNQESLIDWLIDLIDSINMIIIIIIDLIDW